MRRLKVLLSAYCCEPDRGSEPGVGWNIALALARYHDVWVLTRRSNSDSISAALGPGPPPGLHFVYFDLPRWLRWWKRGMRGLQLYYYLWQVGSARKARALHRRVHFDVTHHLTIGRYWSPSFLWTLRVPFFWGPIGGGEDAPLAQWRAFGWSGAAYESLRRAARTLAEHDPFLRCTARHCHAALVATPDTERRLVRLGVANCVRVHGQTGISDDELELLGLAGNLPGEGFRILTVGRLLHWKGVHLGLEALAQAHLPRAEYWIVGCGREEGRLRHRAETLGISEQVMFLGQLPRTRVLTLLRDCDVLLHPSLHDFSPTAILEAMAARKPVLCLALGGPAVQVTAATGIAAAAGTPAQAISELAQGLRTLYDDRDLARQLGERGRRRVASLFTWDRKIRLLCRLYREAAGVGREAPPVSGHASAPAAGRPAGVP